MTTPTTLDFTTPTGASRRAKTAINTILKVTRSYDLSATGGGCRAFYTPAEWKARGERYGDGAVLIVVHDGGSLAPFFNHDYGAYAMMESMREALATRKLYAEQATSWFTIICEY